MYSGLLLYLERSRMWIYNSEMPRKACLCRSTNLPWSLCSGASASPVRSQGSDTQLAVMHFVLQRTSSSHGTVVAQVLFPNSHLSIVSKDNLSITFIELLWIYNLVTTWQVYSPSSTCRGSRHKEVPLRCQVPAAWPLLCSDAACPLHTHTCFQSFPVRTLGMACDWNVRKS